MIEVKQVFKSFDDVSILRNINLTLEKGKVNIIIGQSGSGKSVLTKCIVGLHEVDSGEILYNGENFVTMNTHNRKELRKQMGMLFQGSALFDSKTVLQNVMFPLEMFTKYSSAERKERAQECLNRVNINGKDALFPSEISGGMQKRVAIARAIALNPKYLFCDEPNSGLDPQTSILIDNLIQEITYEYDITTMVITHDMNSVIEIGDNINFLYKGDMWWKGNKRDILHTDNKEINEFVYASKFMAELKSKF